MEASSTARRIRKFRSVNSRSTQERMDGSESAKRDALRSALTGAILAAQEAAAQTGSTR